ncbi:MAG: hypothetical protein L0Z62_34945, partial [Gemmataceae bacterium]|nr:hypothetical protein [Gemmataceae bacterium]
PPGTFGGGFAGDGGQALFARLNNPHGVVVDTAGNLYIADSGNSRIRKVSATGVITPFAGSGTYGGWDCYGEARCAALTFPTSLALDRQGNLYMADRDNDRIRKITSEGRISTVAGSGWAGAQLFTGDGGPATQAHLNKIEGVAVDSEGGIYIADTWNQRIRKVVPTGVINTVVGSGPAGMRNGGFSGDGGPATSARLNFPRGVAIDNSRNIYIADSANDRIRIVTPQGQISTVLGGLDPLAGFGQATHPSLRLRSPGTVAVDSVGNLFIADTGNHRVLKASPVQGAELRTAPQIAPDSVLNAASYSRQIAPGSIVSIFGVNLARETANGTTLPLPRTLADTTLLINGFPAPLFKVSPGQINAQVPFEAGPGPATILHVYGSAGAFYIHHVSFSIGPAGPGIFQFGERRAVAVNEDGTVNAPENPARAGSTITAYLTGLGYVDGSASTGSPAPLFVLLRPALTARATIGGRGAELLFIGLVPGLVGLAQANIRVPTVESGNHPLVVTVGDAASNSPLVSVGPN